MGFKDKWNELVYSFSTEDRYADYESHNHHTRTAGLASSTTAEARGDGIQLNDATSFDDEEEQNNGVAHSTEGVSEVILAWRHIETWTNEHHTDLNASLSDPCTRMDISKAEEDLGITFPPPVRASLRIHDGQEDLDSLTGSGGLFYGLQLMSLDDIATKTNAWRLIARKVELEHENEQNKSAASKLISPIGSSSEVDKTKSTSSLVETQPGYGKVEANDQIDPDLQRKISTTRHIKPSKPQAPRQQSLPPGAIQAVYAHPNWIPLVTDNAGNHIGVDLAPGPRGVWGQVILFGREFDTKFVLAKTWGDFLLNFAKDLESGNFWIYNEEDVYSGEGELVFFDKRLNKEVPYLQVLSARVIHQWRAQQKDLPPQPPKEQKKTHVSHIVPGSSERIISTDITNHKLVEEEDLLDKDISEETKSSQPVETKVVEAEVKEEEPTKEVKEEVKEVKETEEEEIPVAEEEEAKEIDDKLVNDFKDVAI